MIKHICRFSVAIILILVGIAGLILPLIPGILLIFCGVSLIVEKNPKVVLSDIMAKAKEKYQKKCL